MSKLTDPLIQTSIEQFKEYVEKNGPEALSQFEFDYRIHSLHENARKMITPIAEKIIDMVYRN